MKKNYIEVIQEEVDREEFTDREKILQELFDWAVGISSYKSKSIALISPRRYGKTAVLQRLYNKLFWEQDVVAPFYIELERRTYRMDDFADLYFKTFIRQYVGFYLKDEIIAMSGSSLEDLKEIAQKNNLKGVSIIIDDYQKIKPIQRNFQEMWRFAQTAPSRLCDLAGTYVAVIIDEFQYLEEIIELRGKIQKDITSGFNITCSKKNAPMLVSGSQVTIVTRKVFGGSLGGRFGAIYLDLMDIKDGMKLAFKLSDKHDVPVTANTAQLISEISHGNPYYIWCAFDSKKENKDLTNAKGVEEVYKFEVEDEKNGKIRDFWHKHFKMNIGLLNKDPKNKFGLTKKIILYILKKKGKTVNYEEIARLFKISEYESFEILNNLLEVDIVEEAADGIVRGLKDKMLERVLKIEFKPMIEKLELDIVAKEVSKDIEEEVEKLKKKLKSMRGYINTIVGEEAEIMIKRTMNRFNNQEVDGSKYFNLNKKIKLPKFDRKPYSRIISGFEEEKYQIDFYGKKITKKEKIIWIGESKNWSEKVGIDVVEDLLAKIEHVKKQENTEEVIVWLYGKTGFEEAAIKLMQENGILYSDKNNLLDLMDFLGML